MADDPGQGILRNTRRLRQLFSRRDKFAFAVLFVMMCGAALFEVVGVGAVPAFVAAAAQPRKFMSHPIGQKYLGLLGLDEPNQVIIAVAIGLIAVYVAKSLYLTLNAYVQLRITKNRQISLSSRLFRAYLQAPYEFHLQRNSAELLRNVNTEVQTICIQVLLPIFQLLMAVIMTIAICALLFWAEPLVTLATIAFLSLAGGLFVWKVNRKTAEYGSEAQQHRREMIKIVQQAIGGIKDAQLAHRQGHFVGQFTRSAQRTAIAQTYRGMMAQVGTQYLEALAVTAMMLVCIFLSLMDKDMTAIAPTLALFAMAMMRLRANIGKIVVIFNGLSYSMVSIAPVYEDLMLLERQRATRRVEQNGPEIRFERAIELRNITYRYPESDAQALHAVSLTIPKGSSVAFVGTTGAGKTTLVDIILGILQPTSGQVLVDGLDIRHSLRSWQSQIGYVPQFIYLIDDTVRRNIAMGMSDDEIEDERVWSALRAAQLEEFVREMPEGLDTVVGEMGVRISGGQRQRLGIARALYSDPLVLVLDEGTSALDNATERAVVEAVQKLRGGRTILMIAHRLSTVRDCDTLFFLRDGELEVSGTYEALLSKSKEFTEMAATG